MSGRATYYFKAATSGGVVVTGSVAAASPDQVTRDLLRQGLIPVRVWPVHRWWAPMGLAQALRGLLQRFIPHFRNGQ